MNQRSKRLLIIFAVAVGLLAFFLYTPFFTKSTVRVDLSELGENQAGVQVYVDNKLVNKKSGVYEATVGRGKHEVRVAAPNHDIETNTFRSFFKTTFELKPKAKELTAEDIVKRLYSSKQDILFYAADYYGERDWILYSIGFPRSAEGTFGVATYNPDLGVWLLVSDGTVIDLGIYEATAPKELLDKLKGFE